MRPIVALLLCALSLAACTQKDAASDTTKVALAGTMNGAPVVSVTAKDFTFEAPDTIRAGLTEFRLRNEGTTLHHMILFRLDSGKTLHDLLPALDAMMKTHAPPPAWAVMVGGPNAPDPHSESNATMTLQPGAYAMLCFVDVPGGVPHVAKGMAKSLTVVPATSGMTMAMPTPDDTISLSDYKFTLAKPLSVGTHVFHVANAATQPHEIELIKLAPGKSLKDLQTWMQAMKGPPPGAGVGGVVLGVGTMTANFTADIAAADYVLICFFPDAKDGKPHFEHGMVLTQTAK